MSLQSNAALINYPAKAALGRTLPKNKIYEHSNANTRLKNLFVEQVDQIIWQYKLAPETVNLGARPDVPEIQIFTIQLKTPDLNQDVLRCIDGAVHFPIIFELKFDGRIQVIAAYKRPSESDASRWVLSDYFATVWLPSDIERVSMPLALDMSGLYEQILQRLIPMPARQQEDLAGLVTRIEKLWLSNEKLKKPVANWLKKNNLTAKWKSMPTCDN